MIAPEQLAAEKAAIAHLRASTAWPFRRILDRLEQRLFTGSDADQQEAFESLFDALLRRLEHRLTGHADPAARYRRRLFGVTASYWLGRPWYNFKTRLEAALGIPDFPFPGPPLGLEWHRLRELMMSGPYEARRSKVYGLLSRHNVYVREFLVEAVVFGTDYRERSVKISFCIPQAANTVKEAIEGVKAREEEFIRKLAPPGSECSLSVKAVHDLGWADGPNRTQEPHDVYAVEGHIREGAID